MGRLARERLRQVGGIESLIIIRRCMFVFTVFRISFPSVPKRQHSFA